MSDPFDFESRPMLYAVMGNPVEHSRSPEIHQAFAEQASVSIEYRKIQVDVGGFAQAVSNFQASGGRGLNVTVPFKIEAWRLADKRTERAETARAANTLWFDESLIHADNTDGVGLCRDIGDNLGVPIAASRVLVLGAGGAVRGVMGEVLARGPGAMVIANRTVDKAVELARIFGHCGPVRGCGFDELEGMTFDIVVNGTAASLHGEALPLPAMHFSETALAYDMVYGKDPTRFMAWARSAGIKRVADGLGMLVEQAAESFYVWHGKRPDTRPVIEALRS